MAVVVQTNLVADLVAAVRTDSDLNRSQVYTDGQIATLISDAGSKLRDVFTGANQLYNVSTFDFTLPGGVGGDRVDLPDDFQQGHSVDVNPDTAQPYTLRYLSNWLDRNRLNLAPFAIWGPGGGPRCYAFLDTKLVVMPPMGASGIFRLYYTPIWVPLAIPKAVDVELASISIPTSGSNVSFSSSSFLDAASAPWLSTDVGCSVVVNGAVNPGNNGSHTIASYVSATRVSLSGTFTPETLPPTATVTLLRQSRVSAAGTWTLYGNNPFSNPTINVKVGDTLVVSGASNPGNNGSFIVTQAAVGGNTIVTAGAAGLVAENFNGGTFSVSVQPAGTRPDLPKIMNPWVLYLKTVACITIRKKRGQDVAAFETTLAQEQARVDVILQVRHDEPEQPPLTRNSGFWSGW